MGEKDKKDFQTTTKSLGLLESTPPNSIQNYVGVHGASLKRYLMSLNHRFNSWTEQSTLFHVASRYSSIDLHPSVGAIFSSSSCYILDVPRYITVSDNSLQKPIRTQKQIHLCWFFFVLCLFFAVFCFLFLEFIFFGF